MSSARGLAIARCGRCGAGYFPRRSICRLCGGRTFETQVVTQGVVEEITNVRRAVGEVAREATVLATIRLDGGQRVIAGSATPLEPGAAVVLSEAKGAVLARKAA